MNINLHIERLVLEGLPVAGGQGAVVQAAAESELARLLTSEGFAPKASMAEAYITAGAIQLRPAATPRQLGRQIGQTVFASVLRAGVATDRSNFTRRSNNKPQPERNHPHA